MLEYKHLSPEEREHFVQHGWIKVPGAIQPKYIDEWMKDFWVRLGWDEHDKSTWAEPYLKMPRHREVLASEFCPEAWAKMCEIVGGEERIDPVRERWFGDQFICNFGSEAMVGTEFDPARPDPSSYWHTDNDWYRHFLDASNNALTIICCFTDILPNGGGGTQLCEDGMKRIMQTLYEHPEGIDPPCGWIYKDIGPNATTLATVDAKAGDVFITHTLLPHASTPNRFHYARVITNPHVNLTEPYNLNRPDGDYTLCEQVILRHMGRSSIPEYKPTRERMTMYPRTAFHKRARVAEELERMLADAKQRGLGPESVDSVYLRGEEALREHERRCGYDKPFGPSGVQKDMNEKPEDIIAQRNGDVPKEQIGIRVAV